MEQEQENYFQILDEEHKKEETLESTTTATPQEPEEPCWRELYFTTENSFQDLVDFLNVLNIRLCDVEDRNSFFKVKKD